MNEFVKVKLNIEGREYEALILMNYSFDEEEYCIYAVKDDNGKYNIYYGRIVNNILVPDNVASKNSEIASAIAMSIAKTLK